MKGDGAINFWTGPKRVRTDLGNLGRISLLSA